MASYNFIFKATVSIILVLILFLGIRNSLEHKRPKDYKTPISKKIFGWFVLTLSIALFISTLLTSIPETKYALDMVKQYDPNGFQYHNIIDYYLEPPLAMLSGPQIIFPGLLLVWGYYVLKSGPLYSPKWKRVVKTILYILVTFIISFSIINHIDFAIICMLIVYVIMIIIVAMKSEYINPAMRHITEDIEL